MELSHGTENEDPYEVFGFGIQAYFNMLEILIKLFFLITILMMPVMYIYYEGGAYENMDFLNRFMAPITMGNIGHAKTECQYHFLQNKQPSLV